jgi:outer membrane protein assembly factor BamB
MRGLRVVPLAIAASIAAACSQGATGPTAASAFPASPTVSAPTSPTAGASPVTNPADWPTYHRDSERTGAANEVAGFSGVDPAWQTDVLSGDVYAEPLVVAGKVIVATERNTVYAFDVTSGAQDWRAVLGTPVDAGTLPCGNISPVTGITGTPVVDTQAGVVYVVAFEQPTHHELYAIDLASGAVRYHRGIDPPGADPRVHQQRAALALANGYVYVAYGGLAGDCGNYHGWVVGAQAGAASGDLLVYQVPARREGGIWAPSGIAADANGRIFVVTGNSDSSGTYDYNDAVLRLAPDLKVEDYWAPTNWLSLSRSDTDIGSTGPTLIANGMIVEAGKNGILYLLRADRLGGIGGEAQKLQVCGAVFGGFAAAAGVVYVPCTDGVAAVMVTTEETMRTLWRGPRGASGPPIVAAGALWVTDPSTGALFALDLSSGQVRFERSLGAMQHFTTPTAFRDLILVAAGGRVVALRVR